MSKDAKETVTQWVSEYGDDLYSWAFYKTSNKEVAEDLTQETFIAAFSNIDKFQEKSEPKTWLFSILKNKIIDFYRKKAKGFSVSYDEYFQPMKQSDDLFNENERWNEASDITSQHWLDNPEFTSILSKCKDKLPENWQLIIQAKFVLNKESALICQEIGITPSNYWQIMHRSKLLLKKCIEFNWI